MKAHLKLLSRIPRMIQFTPTFKLKTVHFAGKHSPQVQLMLRLLHLDVKDNALLLPTNTKVSLLFICYDIAFVMLHNSKSCTYNNSEVGTSTSTYKWKISRGCDSDKTMKTGSASVAGIHGVVKSNYVCDFSKGTRCNGGFGGD